MTMTPISDQNNLSGSLQQRFQVYLTGGDHMRFFDDVELMVGEDLTYIEDNQLDAVTSFCKCAEELCKEIDSVFYGAAYDKDKKVFIISIFITEMAFKKGSRFWDIMNTADAVRFLKIPEQDQIAFKVLHKDAPAPDIGMEFSIYLGEDPAGYGHQGKRTAR